MIAAVTLTQLSDCRRLNALLSDQTVAFVAAGLNTAPWSAN